MRPQDDAYATRSPLLVDSQLVSRFVTVDFCTLRVVFAARETLPPDQAADAIGTKLRMSTKL